MAPFKSSLAKSATKLLGVFRDRDLSLRGFNSSSKNLFFSVSGGTKITSGSNVYHVFTSSGSLVVSGGLNKDIELVVVGGGGGTGGTYTGGGGGGGVAHGPSVSVSPGTYPVTVGDGGSSTSTEAGDANSPGGTSSIVLPAGTIRGLGGGTGSIDAFQTYGDTYIHGGSGGGNGDDNSPNSGDATQLPAKIIKCKKGDMIFECEDGNILLRARNVFVDANGGGQDGQFTVKAERIADIGAPDIRIQGEKITVKASKDMSIIAKGQMELRYGFMVAASFADDKFGALTANLRKTQLTTEREI